MYSAPWSGLGQHWLRLTRPGFCFKTHEATNAQPSTTQELQKPTIANVLFYLQAFPLPRLAKYFMGPLSIVRQPGKTGLRSAFPDCLGILSQGYPRGEYSQYKWRNDIAIIKSREVVSLNS